MIPVANTRSALKITNARSSSISAGGASPVRMAETLLYGRLEQMTFRVIRKVQDPVTLLVQEQSFPVSMQGSWQPLKLRELEVKPEGERAWTWIKIYALPQTELKPKDVIELEGQKYRVMGSKPWKTKGWMYYECVADYDVPANYAAL